MTHRASIPGAPVSTTICPVPGDTCPASVPGLLIADVVKEMIPHVLMREVPARTIVCPVPGNTYPDYVPGHPIGDVV